MKIYDYHFLITDELKDELNLLAELNKYSFSGKINFILTKISTIPHFLELLKINDESAVENLKSRKDIHLYIKDSLYETIKYYHGKFNYYSLAKFVRMCVRIFIRMVKEYGFEKALKRIKKKINVLRKTQNSKKRIKIIQLLNILGIKYNKNLKLDEILIKLLL